AGAEVDKVGNFQAGKAADRHGGRVAQWVGVGLGRSQGGVEGGKGFLVDPTSNSAVVGAARISSKKTSRAGSGTVSRPSGGSRISPTRVRSASTCSEQR